MKENFKEALNFKLAWADLKKDFTRNNIRKTIWNYLLIILGSIFLAAGDELFLIPYGIVSGGVGGLGIIFNKAFSWDAELTITVAQWILFVAGFFLLGAKFALRTLVSSAVYPTFLFVFKMVLNATDFFSVGAAGDSTALIIAGGIGGVLVGIGCGLTFAGGGSTGGTDCVTLAMSKYWNLKASVTSFLGDMLIIVSNIFFDHSVVPIIIGLFSAFFCAVMIDKTYIGSEDTYVGTVVSDKWELINNEINAEMVRGTTLYDCYGGYTGEDKVAIEVVFNEDEYDTLQKIVYRTDPSAFLTIVKANEVTGYGFRKVPSRINREIKFEEKNSLRKNDKKENQEKIKSVAREQPYMLPSEKISPKNESRAYNKKDEAEKAELDKEYRKGH
jgi:uncharacterized membrane-anchored protein YitT (DUF2179 family)